jgi:predicted metalloprotease
MEWKPGGISDDVEDRRSEGGGGFSGGGFGGRHIGIGGALVLLVLSLVFHRNLFTMFLGDSDSASPVATSTPQSTAAENTEVQFVSFVLDDVQGTWQKLLPAQGGRQYRHAKLVLFRDSIDSACGQAESATGPFYCPDDEKVYLDLGFFDELRGRFGAPGEFAQAYVIAHEIGHHVQKILGIEGRVQRMRSSDPREANPLSVRLELQADCFAVHRAAKNRRPRRGPGRPTGCRGSGRRPPSENGNRARQSGELHPWVIARADAVVPGRPEFGPDLQLRYFRPVAARNLR